MNFISCLILRKAGMKKEMNIMSEDQSAECINTSLQDNLNLNDEVALINDETDVEIISKSSNASLLCCVSEKSKYKRLFK